MKFHKLFAFIALALFSNLALAQTTIGPIYRADITGLTGGTATDLDGAFSPTAVDTGKVVIINSSTYGISHYRLVAGTDAEDSPEVIRPDNYAAVTNEVVWKLNDLATTTLRATRDELYFDLNLMLHTDGDGSNVFLGKNTATNIDPAADQVTMVGGGAGTSLTSGDKNTFIGNQAGAYVTTGSNNTFIGQMADTGLVGAGTGSDNVAIGTNAWTGGFGTDFSDTVVIGSGSSAGGNGSISIGQGLVGGAANEIIIGDGASGGGANSVQLGNASTTAGYVGNTTIAALENNNLFTGSNSFTQAVGLDGGIDYGNFLTYRESGAGQYHTWQAVGFSTMMYMDIVAPAIQFNDNLVSFSGAIVTSGNSTNQGNFRIHDADGQRASITVGAGLTANTTVALPDVTGEFKLSGRIDNSAVALTADDQALSAANVINGIIRLTSDDATAANRTFTLPDPAEVQYGKTLILQWNDATNAGELLDSGNVALSAAWTPDENDTLSLVFDGTIWVETARSAN